MAPAPGAGGDPGSQDKRRPQSYSSESVLCVDKWEEAGQLGEEGMRKCNSRKSVKVKRTG